MSRPSFGLLKREQAGTGALFGLTERILGAMFLDVIDAWSQMRMAMMRAQFSGAAVPLAVCV
jgi:hypothetical protein